MNKILENQTILIKHSGETLGQEIRDVQIDSTSKHGLLVGKICDGMSGTGTRVTKLSEGCWMTEYREYKGGIHVKV